MPTAVVLGTPMDNLVRGGVGGSVHWMPPRPSLNIPLISPRIAVALQSPSPRAFEPVTPDHNAPALPFYSSDDVKGLSLPGIKPGVQEVFGGEVVNEKEADAVFDMARRRSTSDESFFGLRSPNHLAAGSFPGLSTLPTPNLSQFRINQLQQRPAALASPPFLATSKLEAPRHAPLPTVPVTVPGSNMMAAFAGLPATEPIPGMAHGAGGIPGVTAAMSIGLASNIVPPQPPVYSLSFADVPAIGEVNATSIGSSSHVGGSSVDGNGNLKVNSFPTGNVGNIGVNPSKSGSASNSTDSGSGNSTQSLPGARKKIRKGVSAAVAAGVLNGDVPTCNICNASFARRSNLYKHLRSVHSSSRQYKCSICDLAFKRADHRSKHMRGVHSKERRYRCEICGTAFAEKYNKTKHVRVIHETKRPYRCNCGAYFQHKDQMMNCLRCNTSR